MNTTTNEMNTVRKGYDQRGGVQKKTAWTGLLVGLLLAQAQGETVLFSDTFSVTENKTDINFENTTGRQSGGMLGVLNYTWAGDGAGVYSQVGHAYCPGALLLIGLDNETVHESPDHNFTEDPGTNAVSFIRFKIDPVLPLSNGQDPAMWVGVKIGASFDYRNTYLGWGDGIGLAFRGNGNFTVFDGSTNLGEWPYTTDTSGFHAIEFRIMGPVDGNPWDGMNGTALAVFDHGKSSPFFCYRKPGAGYTNNWITLTGASGVNDGQYACHGVDDLQIGTGASVVSTNLSLKIDLQHTTYGTAPEKQVDCFDFNQDDAGSATYPTAAGPVTVALSGLDEALGGFYNRGGVVNGGSLTFAGIYNDFAFKNGASPQTITLTLSGPSILPRERYTLIFYSYDDDATAGDHSVVFSGMSGTSGSAGPLTWTGGADPTSNTAYAVSGVFKASAAGTLTVSITDTFSGAAPPENYGLRLNAIEIKAEPLFRRGTVILGI